MVGDTTVRLRLGYLFLAATVLGLSKGVTVQKDSACGVTVGCFHDCSSAGTCTFLLTWVEDNDDMHLVLTCARSETDPYCAIGLSANLLMGPLAVACALLAYDSTISNVVRVFMKLVGSDSVFECLSTSGTANIYVSYNSGYSNSRLDSNQYGLSSITTSYSNGILTCDFKRKKTFALVAGRRKRAVTTAGTYFDMNTDWYLLYAHGTNSGGTLSKHGTTPLVSSSVADFQSLADISATTIGKTLKKAHGILMVFAWVFFSSLGMFIARFYKKAWPENVQWFGGQPWFLIHRVCMVLGLLLTSTAFIIIFVDVEKYSEIFGSSYQKSHPVLGIIVMSLMVINPVVALFRPKPDHPRRIVFRVVHLLIAVAAEVMAILNLFSGTNLDSINISSNARTVLGVYCAWYFTVQIGLLVYDCTQNDQNKTGVDHELKEPGEQTRGDQKRGYNIVKVVVLMVHIPAQIAVVIAVSVIIADGD